MLGARDRAARINQPFPQIKRGKFHRALEEEKKGEEVVVVEKEEEEELIAHKWRDVEKSLGVLN